MKCIWTVVIPGHQGGMVNDSVHGDNEVAPKSTVVKFELQVIITINPNLYVAFRFK